NAEASRDARVDGDRPEYRDSALSRIGGEPPAGRLRPQARWHRLQCDRRQAGALLLPDRGPAPGGFQPVLACAREDRAVREGAGRGGEAGGGGGGERISEAIGRQEYLMPGRRCPTPRRYVVRKAPQAAHFPPILRSNPYTIFPQLSRVSLTGARSGSARYPRASASARIASISCSDPRAMSR